MRFAILYMLCIRLSLSVSMYTCIYIYIKFINCNSEPSSPVISLWYQRHIISPGRNTSSHMIFKAIFLLFCVSGVTFKAHRLILAACSKHFQELFEGMPPSPTGLIVILDGTSANDMESLLEFMYRGEVHVTHDSLSSFFRAAECLQVCAPVFFRK